MYLKHNSNLICSLFLVRSGWSIQIKKRRKLIFKIIAVFIAINSQTLYFCSKSENSLVVRYLLS